MRGEERRLPLLLALVKGKAVSKGCWRGLMEVRLGRSSETEFGNFASPLGDNLAPSKLISELGQRYINDHV